MMMATGGDKGKPKRPKGWYGKEARAARAAAWAAGASVRAARKAAKEADSASRARILARTEPMRISASKRLFALPEPSPRPETSDIAAAAVEREGKRVDALLRRDRSDHRAEMRRQAAEDEIEAGNFKHLDDAVVLPTREQLRQAEYELRTIDKTDGTVRSTQGMKRVLSARIVQLHQRGILTDDTYPAVLWYRRAWEKTGYETVLSASRMAERSAGGERAYGHMARTAIEAEARKALDFGASFIPADMRGTFDRVVLEEMSIRDAARAARCRYTNITAVVKHSALRLLGGIAHLLPVRAVGAPGSAPDDLARLRKVEALEAGAATDGEREAAGAAAERLRERIDPVFLDERGFLLPWDEISRIILERLAEGPAEIERLGGER